MPSNRYATPEVLAEIRRIKADLKESECRKRAERIARQQSEKGRADMVRRIRDRRRLSKEE